MLILFISTSIKILELGLIISAISIITVMMNFIYDGKAMIVMLQDAAVTASLILKMFTMLFKCDIYNMYICMYIDENRARDRDKIC